VHNWVDWAVFVEKMDKPTIPQGDDWLIPNRLRGAVGLKRKGEFRPLRRAAKAARL